VSDAVIRASDIPLWPDGAPGSETWNQTERESVLPPHGIRIVRNVTRPTLAPYLPPAARATGTAVIVCPGGAFHFLAIEHEGTAVAEWLVARGVAAFILRYRVLQTPDDDERFQEEMRANLSDRERMRELFGSITRLAFADGQQAVRVVRGRAAEWGVRSDRIGLLGFSAGGVIAGAVAFQHDEASRPDFAAPIYPAPIEFTTVPSDAPPLFLALASDDDMAVNASLPLYSRWRAAGRPVELHIFARGGHGFGMRRQGLASDNWIELFTSWLADQGLLPHSI